jgi:hypothetical protein
MADPIDPIIDPDPSAAGGKTHEGQGGRQKQVLAAVLATEHLPDVPMPPKKKQKDSAQQQQQQQHVTDEAMPQQQHVTDEAMPQHQHVTDEAKPSQQAAADAVYHEMLSTLRPEDLDFVRNDEIQWPAIRTGHNKMGEPSPKRKKGDWSAQRSRFIKQVFLQMYMDSESDEDTLLDLMFNGGKYDWLKDTARVIRAVQARYSNKNRGKAFTALFQLCEVKCGAYLAESCFDEEYKAAKMVYIDMQKNPDKPPPTEYKDAATVLGYITMIMAVSFFSPSAAVAVASCSVVARVLKQKAYAALDAEEYGKAQQFMRSAKILESQGFVDTDKERPPPVLEDITDLCDSHAFLELDEDDGVANDVLDDDCEILASLEAMETDDDGVGTANEVLDEILGSESEMIYSESEGEQEEDMLQVADELPDYSAGCPPKNYATSVPTPEERRIWEVAAQNYYQFLLNKYQAAIENLRLEVLDFLSQENLDVSKFLERRLGKKKGLERTRAYFALATLYGDVDGTYEPQRLDWYRAQFTTSLPDGWELVEKKESAGKSVLPDPNPLPKTCMFVLITEENVVMVLRDGNKNGQNVDQDLTVKAPNLAAMLRLWMEHARSAQLEQATYPFVVFKTGEESYGKSYDDSSAYGKLIKRAWKTADVNPQEDAEKEWATNDKKGVGCDWARKVTGRARRGVVCKKGEQRDDMGTAAQGHSASTERTSYRAL